MLGSMEKISIRFAMIMAKIFYVMGASGVGKDSILKYARENISNDLAVAFSHRYITRPIDVKNENHIQLSESEFKKRQTEKLFAMSWYCHDTYYAIGIEIEQWLKKGVSVVINGSRDYFFEAVKLYPQLIPVLVHASKENLEKRLLKRGRENKLQIESRLARAETANKKIEHPKLVIIENNALLKNSGEAFLQLLSKEA